ncbi:unnamed protein product, partial [Oikopleura dioica]
VMSLPTALQRAATCERCRLRPAPFPAIAFVPIERQIAKNSFVRSLLMSSGRTARF